VLASGGAGVRAGRGVRAMAEGAAKSELGALSVGETTVLDAHHTFFDGQTELYADTQVVHDVGETV